MKKTILFSLAAVTSASSVFAREIKAPQMPRGLTADKTQTVQSKKQAHTAPRKLNGKRKGLQGYKKYNTFSDMSFEELVVAKNKHTDAKNWDIAAKYLDRMIKLCDDINTKATIMIELADILFNTEHFDDAAKWYQEFAFLYPGNEHIEYASYKAIVCSSKKILSIDRDQAPTEKTLELANDFLKRSDVFTKYRTEVLAIQKVCQETLAQSDCSVAQFYITYGNYKAAEHRLKNVRSQWAQKVPEIKTQLAALEVDLAGLYNEFKAPEESIKLAQATQQPAAPTSKKADMTKRF